MAQVLQKTSSRFCPIKYRHRSSYLVEILRLIMEWLLIKINSPLDILLPRS